MKQHWSMIRSTTAVALGLAAAAMACAAGPTVSIPSTPDTAGKLVVKGQAVAPLANITVRFAHAQAAPIDMVVQSSAAGQFAASFSPPIPGSYKVTVFDSGGREIGRGSFGVQQK